ncbi:hypothetical protein [Bradyrhizobium elkanii]|uniref:hypothetical protein n=1 Tax=Bradyrhizobium elkanii TaxID=29448 RepID=UPI00114CFE71|nr:hypothetical protein [Bradyrhizobium elkanii]
MRSVEIEPMPAIVPVPRSFTEIDRDEIMRQALEAAAKGIEVRNGNVSNRHAWRTVAAMIRSWKQQVCRPNAR